MTREEPLRLYEFVRPWLFCIEPEKAHALTRTALQAAAAFPPTAHLLRKLYCHETCNGVDAFGLHFSNPVGMAAGYDKDGRAVQGLSCLGFGHLELGTVTLRAQPGNVRPRLRRLPAQRALLNHMGFPNAGAEALRRRLEMQVRPEGLIVGVNIGKGCDTPLDEAAGEYCTMLRMLAPVADYITINISSPNTMNLRRLQSRDYLRALLSCLADARAGCSHHRPLLVKLAPDLLPAELEDAVSAIRQTLMDGVVAVNTTIRRDGVAELSLPQEGGLSGRPLHQRAVDRVARIHAMAADLPIIGVGGIASADDAVRMLSAGAVLLQVYTGLVYEGPALVSRIVAGMKVRMSQ